MMKFCNGVAGLKNDRTLQLEIEEAPRAEARAAVAAIKEGLRGRRRVAQSLLATKSAAWLAIPASM